MKSPLWMKKGAGGDREPESAGKNLLGAHECSGEFVAQLPRNCLSYSAARADVAGKSGLQRPEVAVGADF
jgi:hypothetical protein